MLGAFANWQPEYAARGLATFPFENKKPLSRGYGTTGIHGSQQLARKFPNAEGLACMAGARNKLTVIDVDARGAEGERLLADVQDKFGPSKFIVQTGGGGFHAYYRHNGELRQVRPDPRRPIDVLGAGPVALPPSQGSRFRYEIIQGTLDDLPNLTRLRSVPALSIAPNERFAELRAAQDGERDGKFWPYVARQAHHASSLAALVDIARELNEMMQPPQDDSWVAKKCKYWWDKTVRGDNRYGIGQFVLVDHARVDGLMMQDPDAFLLLTFLERQHWGRDFALANEACELMPAGGWRRQRFTAARSRLIEGGFLEVVSPPSFRPNRAMVCRIRRAAAG